MHILHLCRRFHPSVGGVERHVWEVSQELSKQGYRISVITEQNDSALPLVEKISAIQVYRLPFNSVEKKLATWRWVWQHRQLFITADVVQIHDIFWWIWPILHLIKSKVWITFHGWEGQFPVRWQAKLQRWLAAQLAQGTIHVGAWIQEFYWDRPTAVTYGAARFTRAKQNQVKKWLESLARLGKPKPISIVFMGRLESENELEKYLELATVLTSKHPSTIITWAGFGTWAERCATVGKVTGPVTDFSQYLKDADLVWSASYLSMLEAQAAGKVVCAFYSHHLKQRYLETFPGFTAMLSAAEVSTMLEQIEHLLAFPKKRSQLQQAAATFAQSQTWNTVAQLYQNLWQKR
jgi:glycosyltransferase involved in cell wall biosynthesis